MDNLSNQTNQTNQTNQNYLLDQADQLSFFAVRNKQGEWFKYKYGGWRCSWVKELKKARIYNKIGYAKSIVAFFERTNPQYGIPDVVEFRVAATTVHDQTEELAKRKRKQENARKREVERKAKWEYDQALKRLESAKKELENAQNKVSSMSISSAEGRLSLAQKLAEQAKKGIT